MAEKDLVEGPVLLSWAVAPDLWLLRLWRGCAASRDRAAAALGLDLPTATGDTLGEAMCLAPGEWLLAGDHDGEEARLLAALGGAPALLVAVGPGTVRLDIEGVAAADILNKGCSLDLHRRAFAVGRSTRTLLAGLGVTLVRRGEEAFRLYFDRSVSDWLRAWFDEAAREYDGDGVQA